MGEKTPRFMMKSQEEVREAVARWTEQAGEQFDEEFGLIYSPTVQDRWKPRVGPPATSKGYHGVSQDSSYYGLSLLRSGKNIDRAKQIFTRVLEAQVRDKDQRRYGQFKLIYEALDGDVLDGNTTFFVSLALLAAVKEYPDLLGEELVEKIKDALSLIPRHKYVRDLGVSYTNAHLGDAAIELTICDLINDKARFDVCKRSFNYFYEINMGRGFAERLSATYYMVDLVALGMMVSYLKDPHICVRAHEMLSIFMQELVFFEDRQPLPARRTYNQDKGDAMHRAALCWLLGLPASDDSELDKMAEGSWTALCELTLRRAVDTRDYVFPAPRQMRGYFVDQAGYTSYFHKDFTLGTFDHWPPSTVGVQHKSDIPVAFAGASADLVYLGLYSIDAEGILQTHPGTGAVGTPSKTALPRLMYAACQEANVCCVLTNIKGFSCDLKEYGWFLRGLQYAGRLFDSEGRELTGEGTADAQWLFLATDEYFAGVYPLTHFDPTTKNYLESTPTSLRYVFRNGGLDVFAPNFQVDPAIEVKGNNLPAGAILVMGSAKDTELDAFRQACLDSLIEDEWYVDGYSSRVGYRDCERRIGIEAPGGKVRLAYDYLEDEVLLRSFNGRLKERPSELTAVRLGVRPWVCT